MKKAAVVILALCLTVLVSQSLALEISEEHFPGYYVEMHLTFREVYNMLRDAKWSMPSRGDFARTGECMMLLPSSCITVERGHKGRVLLPLSGDSSSSTITGSWFYVDFTSRQASQVLDENLQWLEDRFGPSPVERGKYLVMLGEDLVEVSVYEQKKMVNFKLRVVDNAEQMLSTYGYRSADEVPAAPWVPIGIQPRGE